MHSEKKKKKKLIWMRTKKESNIQQKISSYFL